MKKKFVWLLAATLACGCSQDGLENEALDMNEYAEEASSWKRFAFPRIREKLAPDAQTEFDKKCADLLSFPMAEDFRRSPMMTRTTSAE